MRSFLSNKKQNWGRKSQSRCMKVSCQFQHKIKQDNAAKELKIQVPDCAQAVCQFIMLLVTQGNWVYVHKGTRN